MSELFLMQKNTILPSLKTEYIKNRGIPCTFWDAAIGVKYLSHWHISHNSLLYSILIYLLFLVAAVQVNLPIATNSFSNCLVLGPFNPIFSAISSVLYNTSNSIHASICFCLSDNNFFAFLLIFLLNLLIFLLFFLLIVLHVPESF